MSERKYRQRGYQDAGARERQPNPEPKPREMRAPSFPGFHEALRCARCGASVAAAITSDSRCDRCGGDLHTCTHCRWFEPDRRFECAKPIAERISPKDARNTCTVFEARVTIERDTRSPGVSDARRAFDDLFK